MAKGFDSYKNGLIFGALFGILALFAALGMDSIAVNWIDSVMSWITTGLQGQEWMPEFLVSLSYLNYVVAAIIGGIIGVYIDLR